MYSKGYYLIENERYLFIVLEFVEGENLKSRVDSCGAQKPEQVVEWAKQVCDVLQYLHTLNPPHIHRDIKPANLILTPEGKIKVIDYGIMRTYKFGQLEDTCCLGTRGFAAPEQFGGIGQTDARTDIFALGMTMFNFVTAIDPTKPPYETKPIRQINSALPKWLEEIISKCIELNPDKRYQSVAELLEALKGEKSQLKTKGIWEKLFNKDKQKVKEDPVDKYIETIYSKMDVEMRDKIFYGGVKEAKDILKSICAATFQEIKENNLWFCHEIYLQTWIRSRVAVQAEFMTPTYIREALEDKFSDISADVVRRCVNASLNCIYTQEPKLKEKAMQIEYFMEMVRRNAKKNREIEDKYLDDPEYGFCESKPIFVNGFEMAKMYLARLKTDTGVSIESRRIGPIEVEGITGPVDKYEITSCQTGETFCIYICNYGTRTLDKAPQGFAVDNK